MTDNSPDAVKYIIPLTKEGHQNGMPILSRPFVRGGQVG